MTIQRHVIVIDRDTRRRAAVCFALANEGVYVEPLERPDELGPSWPDGAIMLAYDEGDVLARLSDEMLTRGRWFPVVAFAENPLPQRVVRAVAEGATDYLGWPCGPHEIMRSVEEVRENGGLRQDIHTRAAIARTRIQRLTARERQVLKGMVQGMSNRLIGEELAISARTVEIHRANMMNKIAAASTTEAIVVGIEAALGT